MAFTSDCYNYLNVDVRRAIPSLLKDMDADIGSNLKDFYKHLEIGNCGYEWYVEVDASIKIKLYGITDILSIDKVTRYYGEYQIIYKNVCLFILKLNIYDGKLNVANKYEMLMSFDQNVCSKCKSLRRECGCKAFKTIPTKELKIRANNLSLERAITKFEESTGGNNKTKISSEDLGKIAGGLSKKLNINKREMLSKVRAVVEKNPQLDFNGVVDAVLRSI